MKSKLLNWMRAAGIRCVKTMAQAAAAAAGTAVMLDEVDWVACGSTALMAGAFSILTSLAGLPELEVRKDGSEQGV